MNISVKNAEGDVVAAAPEMDLYKVANQVHKNEEVEQIEAMKQQAIDEEDARNAANTPLTQEDVETLADALVSFAAQHPEPVADLPSNNGVEEHEPEEGETKLMQVSINPVTGEHVPVAEVNEDVIKDDETFEEMIERVKNSDIELNDSPFTAEEFDKYIVNGENSESLFKEISKDTEYDDETIRQLLEVTNRKMKGEEFNVYKALPTKIQELINSYCRQGQVPLNTPNGNQFRNMVTDELINEFISNIGLNRIQTDFAKELEDIFDKGTKELSESIVGYTEERAKNYREAAEQMEDPEKKAKLIQILDNVDEGYNLETLKEYAKNCKIKKYDLERPDKIYRSFLQKYKNSRFNIYGIEMATPIVLRNLNKDAEGHPIPADSSDYYDQTDVDAFFIAFCKQTAGYDPNNNPNQHAYMYYLMYNCIFTEINTGDAKDISIKFLQNIKDVINNLRERNDNFGRKKN